MTSAIFAGAVAPAGVPGPGKRNFAAFGGDQRGIVPPEGQTFGRYNRTIQHALERVATERLDRFQPVRVYDYLTAAVILVVEQVRQSTGASSIEDPADCHA
jgi:hypothetical protein